MGPPRLIASLSSLVQMAQRRSMDAVQKSNTKRVEPHKSQRRHRGPRRFTKVGHCPSYSFLAPLAPERLSQSRPVRSPGTFWAYSYMPKASFSSVKSLDEPHPDLLSSRSGYRPRYARHSQSPSPQPTGKADWIRILLGWMLPYRYSKSKGTSTGFFREGPSTLIRIVYRPFRGRATGLP